MLATDFFLHINTKVDSLPSSSPIKESDKVDSCGVLVPELHDLVRGSLDPLPVDVQALRRDIGVNDLQ